VPKSLRIAVADDETDMRDFYRRMLTVLGHEVTAAVRNGRELVESCCTQMPELVVTDLMMPEMDGIEAIVELWRQQPLPAIMVSAHRDSETLRRLEDAPVMTVLIKPVSRKQLDPAIDLALLRFEHFKRLRDDAIDVSEALRHRKVVERAKRLLLKETGVDEAGAFDRLQRAAGSNQCKVVEAAQHLIAAADRNLI
jgi:response regulator NasT